MYHLQDLRHDYAERRLCSFVSAVSGLVSAGIQADAARDAADTQAGAAREATALRREIFETSRRDLAPAMQVGVGALNELSRIFLGTDSPVALENISAGGLAPIPSTGGAPPGTVSDGVDFSRFRRLTENQGGPGFIDRQNPDAGMISESQARALSQPTGPAPPGALINTGPSAPQGGTFTPGQLSEDERLRNFFLSPDFTFRQSEEEKAINRAAAARGEFFSGEVTDELAERAGNRASGEFNTFVSRLFGLAGLGQDATGTSVNLGQSFSNQAGQDILDAGTARASGIVGEANAFSRGIGNLDFGARNFFANQGTGAASGFNPGAGPGATIPSFSLLF